MTTATQTYNYCTTLTIDTRIHYNYIHATIHEPQSSTHTKIDHKHESARITPCSLPTHDAPCSSYILNFHTLKSYLEDLSIKLSENILEKMYKSSPIGLAKKFSKNNFRILEKGGSIFMYNVKKGDIYEK